MILTADVIGMRVEKKAAGMKSILTLYQNLLLIIVDRAPQNDDTGNPRVRPTSSPPLSRSMQSIRKSPFVTSALGLHEMTRFELDRKEPRESREDCSLPGRYDEKRERESTAR